MLICLVKGGADGPTAIDLGSDSSDGETSTPRHGLPKKSAPVHMFFTESHKDPKGIRYCKRCQYVPFLCCFSFVSSRGSTSTGIKRRETRNTRCPSLLPKLATAPWFATYRTITQRHTPHSFRCRMPGVPILSCEDYFNLPSTLICKMYQIARHSPLRALLSPV